MKTKEMKTKEIKMRVWNGKNFCAKGRGFSPKEILQGHLSESEYSSPDDLIFQWFTGVKDKNGEEIYEGDIIQFDHKPRLEYIKGQTRQVVNGLNYGDFPMAGWGAISLQPVDLETAHVLNTIDGQCCEVIGNIFEDSIDKFV